MDHVESENEIDDVGGGENEELTTVEEQEEEEQIFILDFAFHNKYYEYIYIYIYIYIYLYILEFVLTLPYKSLFQMNSCYWCCFLFWSGHRMRVGYETNDKEKRKNNLNLHLSKSPHHILDSCISDHFALWTIIFLKLYPMG